MARYVRGDAVRLESETYSGVDDTPITPSSITCSVYDPSGRAVVTNASATLVSTGKYTYIYQSAATDPVGMWRAVFTATNGAYTGLKDVAFEVYSTP